MEVSDGAVGESREERPLTSMFEMENVGSDEIVGRTFVMLKSMEPSEVIPGLDGKLEREDGKPDNEVFRLVSNVICGSEVPVELLTSDAPGSKVVVEPRRDDIEVRGFVAIVIELTTGMLSGPIFTARLATKTTVLVPLRCVPLDSTPVPLVKVQTPSV
jgi:hypothetical protein